MRQSALRAWQNADGGWGYYPRKRSRLEPTVYAALVLAGEPAADRAWKLLAGWQNPDGGWRPAHEVPESCWGTALCVTLGAARGVWGEPVKRGVEWLTATTGAETNFMRILIGRFRGQRDYSLKAWPWRPGNSGWLEPTVHALVALKKARAKLDSAELVERTRSGEAQLDGVRSRDGGWNYGSPRALGIDLPSYPETTALALVGLQGRAGLDPAFALAARQLTETPSPLGRAWLNLADRLHSRPAEDAMNTAVNPDVVVTAIEALGAPEGNFHLLKTGVAAG